MGSTWISTFLEPGWISMTISRLYGVCDLPIGHGLPFQEHRWSSGVTTAAFLVHKEMGHDADPAIEPGPRERCAAATTGVPCRCVRLVVRGKAVVLAHRADHVTGVVGEHCLPFLSWDIVNDVLPESWFKTRPQGA